MWLRRADEMYAGITPGLQPADPSTATVQKVPRGVEYRGEIGVQFTPPRDTSPGLAGTLVDGGADVHDLVAHILHLAQRGFLIVHAVSPPGEGPKKGGDWLLEPTERGRTADGLDPLDRLVVARIVAYHHQLGGVTQGVSLKWLIRQEHHLLREGLYEQTVRHGWYPRHPRPALHQLRPRVPRTAAGTAVRIQTLAFKQYLATAEAHQIRFEEAADIFSRYLPWAIALGVAARWAATFAQVVHQARLEGWGDIALNIAWLDLASGGAIFDLGLAAVDLAAGFDFSDLGDLGEGIGELFEGVGELFDGF